jgi:hypothetical protein
VIPKKVNKWIPGALEHHKEGSLHRMLGVPRSETIPFTFLETIRNTTIGKTAKNPTQIGKPSVKVTQLVKSRAVLALNLKRIGQKR